MSRVSFPKWAKTAVYDCELSGAQAQLQYHRLAQHVSRPGRPKAAPLPLPDHDHSDTLSCQFTPRSRSEPPSASETRRSTLRGKEDEVESHEDAGAACLGLRLGLGFELGLGFGFGLGLEEAGAAGCALDPAAWSVASPGRPCCCCCCWRRARHVANSSCFTAAWLGVGVGVGVGVGLATDA